MREAIRRQALAELKEAKARMAAVEGPEMTPEEIWAEIKDSFLSKDEVSTKPGQLQSSN